MNKTPAQHTDAQHTDGRHTDGRQTEQTPTGSLRRRLICSILAMLLIVLVALGILVHVILGDRLRSELRQRVQERAGYATVLAGRGLEAQQLADELTGQGITASVRTASGGAPVVGRDQQPGPPNGAPEPGRQRPGPRATPAVRVTGTPITVTTRHSQVFAEVRVGSSTLLLTASEAELDRSLNVLRNIELVAGAVTLLVVGLVSLAVVRAALAPLHRMTALAERIRAGARGRRLHPSKPNTDLGRTATSLDNMLDSLESAERHAQDAESRMRQFLADASHDLRTPLALMIASAERSLQPGATRAEREQRTVELIREGHRAARLVDDLMLMTRLDDPDPSSELRHEPIDLGALTVDVVERSRLTMRGRTVTVEITDSPIIVGDPDRLTQVLANLLDNARAATDPTGTITVTLSSVPARTNDPDGATAADGATALDGATSPSVARLQIDDDGPGVPSRDRERVFDRFVRLDSARKSGGSGLGLPIARAIARAHRGDVTCDRAELGGGRFILTLPTMTVRAVDRGGPRPGLPGPQAPQLSARS